MKTATALAALLCAGCVEQLYQVPQAQLQMNEYISDLDGLKVVKARLTEAATLAVNGREADALAINLLVHARRGFGDPVVDEEATRGVAAILDPVRALLDRGTPDRRTRARAERLASVCDRFPNVDGTAPFLEALRSLREKAAGRHLSAARAPGVSAGDAYYHCFMAERLGGSCDVAAARAAARSAAHVDWRIAPSTACGPLAEELGRQLGPPAPGRPVTVSFEFVACTPVTVKSWVTQEQEVYETGETRQVAVAGTHTETRTIAPARTEYYTSRLNSTTDVVTSVTIPAQTESRQVQNYAFEQVKATAYYQVTHVDYHVEVSGVLHLGDGDHTLEVPLKLESTHHDSESPAIQVNKTSSQQLHESAMSMLSATPATNKYAARPLKETLPTARVSLTREIGEQVAALVRHQTATLLAPPVDQPEFVGAALGLALAVGEIAPVTQAALIAKGGMSASEVTSATRGEPVKEESEESAALAQAPVASEPTYQPLANWRPPMTEVVSRWSPRGGFVATGLVMFLVTWGADIALTYGYGHQPSSTSLIPIVGPWMQWGDQFTGAGGFTVDNVHGALLISGCLQAVGALVTVVGVLSFKQQERRISFTPTLGGGQLAVSF